MRLTKYQKIIRILFEEDQNDRNSKFLKKFSDKERLYLIYKKDKKRIKIIENILKKGPVFRGADFFRIGFIFGHMGSMTYFKKTIFFAKKGIELNHQKSKWLYAAAVDKILVNQKKNQKFGTLFKKDENGKWDIYPVDKKTTDRERKEFNIISLQEIKDLLVLLNNQKRRKLLNRVGWTFKVNR